MFTSIKYLICFFVTIGVSSSFCWASDPQEGAAEVRAQVASIGFEQASTIGAELLGSPVNFAEGLKIFSAIADVDSFTPVQRAKACFIMGGVCLGNPEMTAAAKQFIDLGVGKFTDGEQAFLSASGFIPTEPLLAFYILNSIGDKDSFADAVRAQSLTTLAGLYVTGRKGSDDSVIIPQSMSTARSLCTRAAALGSEQAEAMLAKIESAQGKMVEVADDLTFGKHLAQAQEGVSASQLWLAANLTRMESIEKSQLLPWVGMAAVRGNPYARLTFAFHFAQRDIPQTVVTYLLLNVRDHFRLGVLPEDPSLKVCHGQSCFMLGNLCRDGRGTSKDEELGYNLLVRARILGAADAGRVIADISSPSKVYAPHWALEKIEALIETEAKRTLSDGERARIVATPAGKLILAKADATKALADGLESGVISSPKRTSAELETDAKAGDLNARFLVALEYLQSSEESAQMKGRLWLGAAALQGNGFALATLTRHCLEMMDGSAAIHFLLPGIIKSLSIDDAFLNAYLLKTKVPEAKRKAGLESLKKAYGVALYAVGAAILEGHGLPKDEALGEFLMARSALNFLYSQAYITLVERKMVIDEGLGAEELAASLEAQQDAISLEIRVLNTPVAVDAMSKRLASLTAMLDEAELEAAKALAGAKGKEEMPS